MGKNIENPKNKANDSKVEEITNVVVPEEIKAPAISKAKEELDNHEAKLTGSNLDKIWVSRSEALNLAQKALNVSDPFDITEFKNAIKKYQKEHNIWIDWKIWKETFIEMKAWIDLKQAQKWIDTYGVSEKTQGEIIWDLENALENWNFEWKNIHDMLIFLKLFKENNPLAKNDQHEDFLSKVVDVSQKFCNSPEWKKSVKNANKKITDLHELVNNPTPENIKNFVNDPTLLLAWWLLFLFGVWTDISFMKRLGILMWGIVFGPYVMKKLWVGKFWDQINESSKNWVLKTAWDSASETSKNVWSWVSENASKAWWSITWFFSSWVDAIWNLKEEDFKINFGLVSWKLESANKSLEKWKEIPEKSFEKLSKALLGDDNFINIKKDKLDNIDQNNINLYLSIENQNLLTNDDKKHIKKYINLLKWQFKEWDVRVRDLFFASDMMEKIKSSYYKTGSTYIEGINSLNEKINREIHSLFASPKKDKYFAAVALAEALKSGNISKFRIENYDLWNNKEGIENILEIYKEYNTKFKPSIERLNLVNVSDDNDKNSLMDDYNLFLKISKISLNNEELKEDFREKLNKKELEIFIKFRDLELWTEILIVNWTSVTVDWYLNKLKIEKEANDEIKINDFKEQLKGIELPIISEQKINIEQYKKYNLQIEKAFKQIEKLNPSNYLQETYNTIAELINNTVNSNILAKSELSDSNMKKYDLLKKLLLKIKSTQLELEKKFDTDVFWLDEIELLKKQEFIRGLSDSYKDSKTQEFKKSINEKINIPFINSIKNLNKIPDLINLEKEYESFVKWLNSDLVGESVKEAYEKRIKMIEVKERNNREIIEIPWLKNDIIKLIKVYKEAIWIAAFNKLNTEKTIIKVLKNTLISFKNLNKNNKDLVNDIDKILNKIK